MGGFVQPCNLNSIFENNNKGSLRVVILVSSLFGFTMYTIYSAFIVSSLRRSEPPVRKFERLIEFDYELIAQRSLPDFTNVYVNNPKVGEYYAEIARKNFISVEDSLHRLFLNSNQTIDSESAVDVAWFALKTDFSYLALQHGYTTSEICEISQLEPVVRAEHPRVLSMFIAKNNSRLREHFNRRILDILARGLGRRHLHQFNNKFQPKCGTTKRKKLNRISFYDVYAAYTLLFVGALAAIVVWLVGELIIPYLWQEKQKLRGRNRYQVKVLNVRSDPMDTEASWGIPRIVLHSDLGSDISVTYID